MPGNLAAIPYMPRELLGGRVFMASIQSPIRLQCTTISVLYGRQVKVGKKVEKKSLLRMKTLTPF
ncbi:hypothetical protein CIPAW_13G140900 [Carya illinoinensis]|uniref:Uncharacterized protein n=1 Tax=Carya illinoinensis TaxID=32201 RepID=A0A8T1NTK9_CARIL|nr:hypothetical protein CIPAW_13G140900 [Carya illinoinensis]